MHHKEIRFKKSQKMSAWINHNSDWSGDVYLAWADANGDRGEVKIPGRVIQQLIADTNEDAIEAAQELLDRLKGE